MFRKRQPNRWQGFVLRSLGAVVGVVAMRYYWQLATALNGGQDPRKTQVANDPPQPLDLISLVGRQHEEGESSTAAMGRIAYRAITGKERESPETRDALIYLVHWLISLGVSGLYGAQRGRTTVPDVAGGDGPGSLAARGRAGDAPAGSDRRPNGLLARPTPSRPGRAYRLRGGLVAGDPGALPTVVTGLLNAFA